MIRDTIPQDTPALIRLAESTGVFKPLEIEALREVLDDYHATNVRHRHRAFTLLDGDRIQGFSYHAPEPMTERSWCLYWIVVGAGEQARGLGSKLLQAVEQDIIRVGGHVLWIETSSLPHYEKTRRFYPKHGYEQEALLRDFYAEGDGKVIFRKRLVSG
jgi:GNAT superfamily N-acetyltransferase